MKALRHFLVFTALCGSALAATRYVAQNAGTFSGGTACNGQTAITYSTFNSTALSAGDITYICGTITTNAAQIIPNGSGSSGNVITIKFDTGAAFSPAACNLGGGNNSCFNLSNLSYILVDGGIPCGPGTTCNSDEEGNISDDTGVISNTANGAALAHQANSQAILASNCSHCEIRNLIIKNIYIESGGSTVIDNSLVQCVSYSGSNNKIHDSTFHDAGFCVQDNWVNGEVNNETYNLDIYNIDHGIILSGISGTASGGPFWIHNNHIHAFSNWDAGSTYHHDAIHCWSGNAAGQTISGFYIYDNTFGGPMGNAMNSFTYIEGSSGPPCMNSSSPGYYFNNLMIQDNTFTGTPGQPWQISGNWAFYNNTSLGYGNSSGPGNNFILTNDSSAAFLNNASTKNSNLVSMNSVSWASGSPNYNLYSLDGFSSSTPFYANGSYTFSGYQSHVGGAGEANSVNPTTSGISYTTGVPATGSGAIGAGTNLYTIASCSSPTIPGLGALCSDLNGNARPSSGAWTVGALNSTSGGQASPPSCSPGTGTYTGAQTVTCTNPNSGTTVMCYNFTGSPATNGDGATCPSGSTAYTGTISISTSETLYIVAGTSTLSDSSIVSYVYTIQFVLSVYNYGASSDTVTSSPSGISCTGSSLGNLCTANFNSAATVTLSHSAAGVDTFTNWSFPGCGVSGTCAVTMSAAESVSAVFAPTLPTLPQTFVDNNELTCKAAGNCYTGSPGLSLTPAAYEYQLGASTWITGPPPTCTFATLPYALSFTGLQNFVTAMEACRTLTGVGITLDVPPGTTMVGTSSNGLVIPQTNTTTATAPLIVRSTNHSSLPAGVTVCAHGVQDNLSTSTDIGIENPDCTGLNMYYALGPTLVSGVISGITTLSTNTTTLAAIAATGSQCVALANGYVAPGVPETIDTGGNQETVSTTSAANKTGMCGNFTKTHASGVAVTYNVGAFTLANGTITNTSTYNDVQYMWTLEAQHTGNSTALTYCNASASLQLPTCTANIGPDHWLIEDMEARMYAGNTGVGFVAQAAGSTVVTSSVQLPTHNHIRKSWIHADWTSTYTGANSVSGGLDWEGIYVSVVDSQISQIMKPGGEHHAMTLDANQVKVNHNWLEGGSIGIFSGGYSGGTGPSIFGWIPLCDGEIRRNHLTWPFSWLGQSPIPASTNPNWPSQFSLVRKNSFEMKGGCRTIVSGNFGENVDASGAQGGTLGELDPKNNSSGTGTYYNSTLNNVTMADNVFRNGCQVWNITTSRSGPGGGTAYPPRSIEWLNNLIYNVSGTNYPDCSTAVGLSLDGGGGTWQGTMTQTDANHVAFVAECSNDLGQCQGQIANVTITGGTCAGSPSLSFPVPNLAGGNQANYGVKCTGSAFTITQNVYGSGYTSAPTPTFTCASCTGTQTVTVTWNSSSSGISTATGFQSFNISAGDPVAITNCVNTAFNTVGTTLHSSVTYVPSGIGPPASYPSTPWNGTFATGNVTVTAPLVGTAGATETSHYCKLTTLEGAPFNLIWNHNTIVSSSTYVVNTGLAFNNSDTDGPTFGANRAMLNSFMVGGTWGSSAISTGTVAQQFMDDTVNSFTADVLVWPGQSGMTAYGLNQFYPIGSPLFYYPTNSYCTGATPTTACIGFLGALSASSLPLTLADYHQYGLAAASAFIAGGSQDASDGTSVGVQSMSLLDNAQTANLFICGSTPCGSPGPFPDAPGTNVLTVIPIAGSGTVTSSPAGISCPSSCTATYTGGTVVTLSETPGGGYTFFGWGGACSGTGFCVVTMTSAQLVTATFVATTPTGLKINLGVQITDGVKLP